MSSWQLQIVRVIVHLLDKYLVGSLIQLSFFHLLSIPLARFFWFSRESLRLHMIFCSFWGSGSHVLFVLFESFWGWEVSGNTAVVFSCVASRFHSKLLMAFLYSSYLAYSVCIILAFMWCMYTAVLTQPQLWRNLVLSYWIDQTSIDITFCYRWHYCSPVFYSMWHFCVAWRNLVLINSLFINSLLISSLLINSPSSILLFCFIWGF